MRSWLATIATLFAAPIACAAQVSARPPDSMPSWFDHDSSWTDGRQCSGALKHVLGVYFREGTSQQVRQEAVNLVHGVVVGGLPLSDGDGAYFLRLRVGETIIQLDSVADVLKRLPQVESVFANYCASPGAAPR